MQIEYCKTRNINLLADRIGVTVSSPKLCSSINHFIGGTAYTVKTPKEIIEYILKRMDELKSTYEIEEKREYLPAQAALLLSP